MEIPVCLFVKIGSIGRPARQPGVTRIPRKMIAIVNREEGRDGGGGKTLLNNETKCETMVTLVKRVAGAGVRQNRRGARTRLNHIPRIRDSIEELNAQWRCF